MVFSSLSKPALLTGLSRSRFHLMAVLNMERNERRIILIEVISRAFMRLFLSWSIIWGVMFVRSIFSGTIERSFLTASFSARMVSLDFIELAQLK